jgi:excinuclease ABC subunit C
MDLTLIKNPDILANYLQQIPLLPGVYLMKDEQDNILYIGKSKKLRNRVRSYFRESQNLTYRLHLMIQKVSKIDYLVTDNEMEALALEATLIKKHQPYFNILLKDDKRYPYICITWSEDYPQIFITRKRRITNKKDRYYGPYTDSLALKNTLALIKSIFSLRQRNKPLFKDRPCLNYDLGRCPGVCQKLISPDEYHQVIQKIAMIFQGRTTELIKNLTTKMKLSAEKLEFEKAAMIREQIKGLTRLSATQKVALPDDNISRDAIALAHNSQNCCVQIFQIRAGKLVNNLIFFVDINNYHQKLEQEYGQILQRVLEEYYSQVEIQEIPPEIIVQHPLPEQEFLTEFLTNKKGKKVNILVPQKQLKAGLIEMVAKNAHYELEKMDLEATKNLNSLQDLANILGLTELPRHIEGYDISHIQGSNAVASQVVFINGVPAKQKYRHFKIKNPEITIGHSDDFASLQEVIKRRFTNSKEQPDLLMIDGGKGQLSSVVQVLEKMGLFSQIKVISLAKKREEIFIPYHREPLNTQPEQPGVQLLRRVRDEAHRFAVSFHRQQRTKQTRRSQLDDIPGLGFQRQKDLLEHFHSLEYIRAASIEELKQVSGIGEHLAKEIFNYFNLL